jgi:hypothetical protein
VRIVLTQVTTCLALSEVPASRSFKLALFESLDRSRSQFALFESLAPAERLLPCPVRSSRQIKLADLPYLKV